MWMFGLAAICWATWKIRNIICFEKVLLRNIFEATFSVVSFMRYWAGMQSEETQRMISMGVNLMVNTAMKLMRGRSNSAVPLTIRDVAQEEGEEVENPMVRMEEDS
jgi:hypothetical protein